MSTFIMIFSGLRQAIATSIGLLAYEFVRKKKIFGFFFCVILACGFHHTAFMLLALYPLYHMNLKRKNLWFVIPVLLIVFVFNAQIFTFATDLLTLFFGEGYDTEVEATGAYTTLVLFAFLAVFAYLIPDEKYMDKETIGLRNILLMAVVLQCFAPVHMLAMRMNYYFIIFIPILIPKILKSAPHRFGDIAWLAKVGMTGFFLIY